MEKQAKRYYVQIIARNYLKNVIPYPATMKVAKKFLYGLDEEQFRSGYTALFSVVRELYGDILRTPDSFNMALKEITDINAKTADYTASNASFLRVPNLLLLLGIYGELQPDLTLTIDSNTLSSEAKALKITGLPKLLTRLKDYGFDISGDVSVAYTDNRALTVALKAMATALMELCKGDLRSGKNHYFYMMHNGLLENEQVKEPKFGIDAIYHVLDEKQREYAAAFHQMAADKTKHTVRLCGIMRNDWTCAYVGKKNKRMLMSLQIIQDKLRVKLNLQHIGEYVSLVPLLPQAMQDVVLADGWDCGGCNPRCSGGFAFELDNTKYNKCHCGSFVFGGLDDEAVRHCKKLLAKEIEYAGL